MNSTSSFLRMLAKISILPILAAPLWASAQVAPGSVTFGPAPSSPVPVAGGAALVVLALVLALFGVLSLRRTRRSVPFALFAAALISGAAGMQQGGVHFQNAVAGTACSDITNPAGETLDVLPDAFNEYCNQSGVIMEVVDFQAPASNCPLPFDSVIPPAIPCEVGTTLAPGGSCQIICELQTSDRRLKTDIRNTGRVVNGFAIYEFSYRDRPGRYRGVMAQEVLPIRPDAVVEREDGYLMVDYGKLGISPERLD